MPCRVSAKWPHSGPTFRRPEGARAGERRGLYFKFEKQLLQRLAEPHSTEKVGKGGPRRRAAHPSHPRCGVGLLLSPGSPPSAGTLLGHRLR